MMGQVGSVAGQNAVGKGKEKSSVPPSGLGLGK